MNDLHFDRKNDVCITKYNLLNNANFNQTRNLCIVKSSILSRYSDECKEEKIFLDTGALCCKWCLNTWSPGSYNLSLKPPKKPSKELQRLLKKDIPSLNKFQKKLITKIKSAPLNNAMVIKCSTCDKNTTIPLKRSGKGKEVHQQENKDLQVTQEIIKRKKKKKKPYAGLNPAVVENFDFSKKMKSLPINIIKTQPKKLNLKLQQRINKEIVSLKLTKKKPSNASKPSLLSSFLESMAM